MDGGANFQWPTETPLCVSGAMIVNPLLDQLVDTVGPAGTYPVRTPSSESAVIGAVATCPAEDLLGKPRPQPCAAGAVEP